MARPHRRPMSKRPDCYELKAEKSVKNDVDALKFDGEVQMR